MLEIMIGILIVLVFISIGALNDIKNELVKHNAQFASLEMDFRPIIEDVRSVLFDIEENTRTKREFSDEP